MTRMAHDLVHPPKACSGERIAVLSPSFAAAGAFPAVHEQAMRRLTEVTGLVPVEYPTTRKVGATALERAADINAAFADPAIRGILAVIGGEDQITVIPHLDAALCATGRSGAPRSPSSSVSRYPLTRRCGRCRTSLCPPICQRISGGWERALVELFLRQLASYRAGKPLANIVDKKLGFVTASS